ncbi:MAG: accessory gene regulator ArgB-like protein [Bacillota bacterium]
MYGIERASNFLAYHISMLLDYDKDHEEVLAYGAFVIIQTFINILCVVIFGKIFGVTLEALIISIVASLLRKYSGGVHATSPGRCIAIGTIGFVGMALLVDLLVRTNITFVAVSNVLSLLSVIFIITKYAPVDTPDKRIVDKAKRERLRRQALEALAFLTLLQIIFWLLYFYFQFSILLNLIISICLGVIWQSFTLTALGHAFIIRLDMIFKDIYLIIGGER